MYLDFCFFVLLIRIFSNATKAENLCQKKFDKNFVLVIS